MSENDSNSRLRNFFFKLVGLLLLGLFVNYVLLSIELFQNNQIRGLAVLLVVLYTSGSLFLQVDHKYSVVGNRCR